MPVQIEDNRGQSVVQQDIEEPIKSPFPTTDTELAAVLMASGYKCREMRTKKDNSTKRIVFVFDHDLVKEDIRKWLNGDLRIEPRNLLNILAKIKFIIHSKGAK